MARVSDFIQKLLENIDKIAASLFPQPVPVKVDSRSKNPRRPRS